MVVQLKHLEKGLKALANKRRLHILQLLKKNKEASVGAIAEQIKLSFKSTSRHLSVLFSAGIVEKEQRGPEVYYFIVKDLDTSVRGIVGEL